MFDLSFEKSAAKVVIFSETAKLFAEILLFGGFPVAVDDLAVLRFLIDVNTYIAGKSTYVEVLITIVQAIHFDALCSVVFKLDGLGFLLERAIDTLGNALIEEHYKFIVW